MERRDTHPGVCRILAVQLAETFRLALVHDPAHPALAAVITRLSGTINSLIKTKGMVEMVFHGGILQCNDTVVISPPEHPEELRPLVEIMGRAGIRAISFSGEVTPDDCGRFLASLAVGLRTEEPAWFMTRTLDPDGPISIEPGPEHVREPRVPDPKERVRGLYHSLVSFAMELPDQISAGAEVDLRRLKRLLLYLIDMIEDGDHVLLGMTLLRNRYDYVFYHPANVSILSVALGHRTGLSRRDLVGLGMAGFFYDVGKYLVSPEVLLKTGKYGDREWRIMRKHTALGFKSLFSIRDLDEQLLRAAIVSFEHHLNYNLSGYPKVRHIPEQDLYTRIVAIAETYDALTAVRQHGAGRNSPDEAIRVLLEKAGTEFDPVLIRAFTVMMGAYPVGSLVMLDSAELGIVQEINEVLLKRPKVLVISDGEGRPITPFVADLTRHDGEGRYLKTVRTTLNPIEYKLNYQAYFA